MSLRGKAKLAVALMASVGLVCLAASPGPAARRVPESRRIFVRGGAEGCRVTATPWRSQDVRWIVKSEAGLVAQDVQKSGKGGEVSPRFRVPDVRTATTLAMSIAPQDEPASALMWEVTVLPKDPIDPVRKTVGALGIGLFPSRLWAGALRRGGLEATQLQYDLARGEFRGKVVFLGGLLGQSADATRRWIASLPADVCVVAAACGEESNSLLPVLPCLAADAPPKRSTRAEDRECLLWNDLSPEWLGERPTALVVAQPRGVLSVRVLAGDVDEEGRVHPLAMEATDLAGRRWLIWSPTWLADEDDARWDLLLRNSLLWAGERHRPTTSSAPSGI